MSALLRFLGGVAVAGLVASSASAFPSPSPSPALRVRDGGLSFNPTNIQPIPLSSTLRKRMTNAERFARGLTPNKPHRRSPGQLHARASPTPVSSVESAAPTVAEPSSAIPAPPSSSVEPSAPASSAAPSSSAPPAATCSSVPGKISARNTQQPNGYIWSQTNTFGEYGPTTDANAALLVAFESCSGDDASTPYTLTTTNGLSAYPVLAGILGFASSGSDLKPGSINYAYIGGAASEIPAGSTAQTVPNSFSAASGISEGVETAIWVVDRVTGAITLQWVNSDGTISNLTALWVPSAEAYAVTADPEMFMAQFGTAYPTTFALEGLSATTPATTSVI